MKIPTLPGMEAALSVDGQDLQELDDAEGEGAGRGANDGTAFVEAILGANFAVQFRTDRRFTYRYNDIQVRVYLDGTFAAGKVIYAHQPQGGHRPLTVTGRIECPDGRDVLRKFAFADLSTNDEKPKAGLKEKLANIGEVAVKLYRVRKTGEISPGKDRFVDAVGSKGVPEKALKGRAISSRATLGKAEAIAPITFVTVDFPWGSDPFATFTFKYRSRRDLQIEGLIPRSPSPVPLEERDPDTLSAEEARELVRIQRQKLQDQAKVKKEKREREEDEDEDDDETTVTGEQRKRPRLSNDSGIEVIDLSNEDDEDDD